MGSDPPVVHPWHEDRVQSGAGGEEATVINSSDDEPEHDSDEHKHTGKRFRSIVKKQLSTGPVAAIIPPVWPELKRGHRYEDKFECAHMDMKFDMTLSVCPEWTASIAPLPESLLAGHSYDTQAMYNATYCHVGYDDGTEQTFLIRATYLDCFKWRTLHMLLGEPEWMQRYPTYDEETGE